MACFRPPGGEAQLSEGTAHAALVFDGEVAVAWCEYGSPDDLPNIYHLKEYNAGLDKAPDYRLTCFFVDRDYRRKGVAAVALRGALDLIAKSGGGVVEGYPQETQGKRTSGSSTTARAVFLRRPASATIGPREGTIA
ncbi:MAG TPA: GNAT family N-acetyltransferase [Candidatus Dormibacteraeota bacterium]